MEETIKKYKGTAYNFDPKWAGRGAWRKYNPKTGKLGILAPKQLQERWGNPNEQGVYDETIPSTIPLIQRTTQTETPTPNTGRLKKAAEKTPGLRSYKSFVSDPRENVGSATLKYVKQQFTPEIMMKNLFGDLAGIVTAKALNVSKERMSAVKGGYDESSFTNDETKTKSFGKLEYAKKAKGGDQSLTLERILSNSNKSNMYLKNIDDYFTGLKSSGILQESLKELTQIRKKLYDENTLSVKFSKSSESRKDLNTIADYFDGKQRKEDIAENFAESNDRQQTSFLQKIAKQLETIKTGGVGTGTATTPEVAESGFDIPMPDRIPMGMGGGKGGKGKAPPIKKPPSKFGGFLKKFGVGAAVAGATGAAATAAATTADAIKPPTTQATKPPTATKIKNTSSRILKGLGPVGAIVSIAALMSNIEAAKADAERRVESGEPEDDVEKDFKKRVTMLLAGEVGGLGGGVLGAIAGQMAIPIPAVGAIIGGVGGAIAGGMAGEALGEKLYDFLSNGGEIPSQEEIREKYENQRRTLFESQRNLPGFDEYGAKTVDPNLPTRMKEQEQKRYDKEREEAQRLITNQENLVKSMGTLKELRKQAKESARVSALPDTTIGMDDMSRDFTKYPTTGKAETEPTSSAERMPQNFTSKQRLLEQIASGEGTSEEQAKKRGYKSGYDVTLGYGKFDPKDATKPITEMTLDELDQFQTEMLKNPENKLNSSAVGKYQIVRQTLRGLKEKLGLKGDEKFTPELQDRLGSELLQQRGMGKFERGEITQEQFQENLAKEWASVATKEGKSFYGQRVGTTSEEISQTLAGLKGGDARTLPSSNITRNEGFQPTSAEMLPKGFEQASDLTTPQRTTGAAIENRAQELAMNREAATSTPPIIAPNTTNVTNVNNNGGGGGRVLASIRNEDPTFMKMQMSMAAFQVT